MLVKPVAERKDLRDDFFDNCVCVQHLQARIKFFRSFLEEEQQFQLTLKCWKMNLRIAFRITLTILICPYQLKRNKFVIQAKENIKSAKKKQKKDYDR